MSNEFPDELEDTIVIDGEPLFLDEEAPPAQQNPNPTCLNQPALVPYISHEGKIAGAHNQHAPTQQTPGPEITVAEIDQAALYRNHVGRAAMERVRTNLQDLFEKNRQTLTLMQKLTEQVSGGPASGTLKKIANEPLQTRDVIKLNAKIDRLLRKLRNIMRNFETTFAMDPVTDFPEFSDENLAALNTGLQHAKAQLQDQITPQKKAALPQADAIIMPEILALLDELDTNPELLENQNTRILIKIFQTLHSLFLGLVAATSANVEFDLQTTVASLNNLQKTATAIARQKQNMDVYGMEIDETTLNNFTLLIEQLEYALKSLAYKLNEIHSPFGLFLFRYVDIKILYATYRDKIRAERDWKEKERKKREQRAQPDGIRGIIGAAAKKLLPGSEPKTPADARAPMEGMEQIAKEREDILAVLKLKQKQDNGGK